MMRVLNRFIREIWNSSCLLTPVGGLKYGVCILWSLLQVVRRRSLQPVDDLFGDNFRIRANGAGYSLKGCSFSLIREIFGNEAYLPAAQTREFKRVVDLGANAGAFTFFCLAHAPECHVIAVEAQPHMCDALSENLKNNQLNGRAKTVLALVGGAHDEWSREHARRFPHIPIWKPDECLAEWDNIDFLKCDVEGAEYVLFDGDLAWMSKIQAFAIETHGHKEKNKMIEAKLRLLGFQVAASEHRNLGYLRGRRVKT